MNKEQALAFLKQHQPMPDNKTLPDEKYELLLREYNEVLLFFESSPDEESIRPFLNSFGDSDGYGVYDAVCTYMYNFSSEQMILPLLDAMKSSHASIRYWAASIAMGYVNESECLVNMLVILLDDSDMEVRNSSLCSLSRCNKLENHVQKIKTKYSNELSNSEKESYQKYLKGVLSSGPDPVI